jgi:hypothetical protein
MILEISKSKYIEWIKEQLEDAETLDEFKYIVSAIPDFTVEKGFNEAQEFLMDTNKDNPMYFTFFIKENIYTDSYGADQIDIKWVD